MAWGDAEALSVADDGRIFAVASMLGRGRVVALGHGGYLGHEGGDTPRFVANAVAWLGERAARGGGLRVLGRPGDPAVARLAEGGLTVGVESRGLADAELERYDVILASPQEVERAGRLADLEAWVRRGGGLLAVECAWGQLQLGRAPSLDALAANRLLAGAGIAYTDAAASPVRDGLYPGRPADAAAEARRRLANAERGLAVLAEREPGDAAFAARVVRDALAVVPLDGPLVRAAERLAERRRDELDRAWAAMTAGPLRPAEHPLAIAMLDLEGRRAAETAAARPTRVEAHPSADAFPGPVDPAYAASHAGAHTITLDPTIPGWRSTGLYARPGRPVTVRFTGSWGEVASASTAGVHLQIGVWLDPQQFAERVRMQPAITRVPVDAPRSRIASPIGGPLLIDLPEALVAGRSADDPIDVVVRGAVPMPHFRLGETALDDWRDEIRHRPVPWAELESDELVLTVPAAVVRGLDRPDLVMEHWDRVHATMHALQPRSPRHWPDRQYRYVCERRLSWGYMYCPANAPIVIPESAADEMVDLEQYDAIGGHQLWGHYHEMGHAHQDPMWTFGGTVEVTVNIFTVLALHRVNGYPLDSELMRSDPARAWRTFVEHREKGAPFEEWRRRPFLALQTYAMLWHAFGFEAYDRAFRAYEQLPASERPRTDAEKRDRWLIEISRATGRNLGPYFDAWGVPVSDAAKAEVATLPKWMPDAPTPDDVRGTD